MRIGDDYALWLPKNEKQVYPNAIVIRALQEQWKPMAWRDEYLELPNLESPGQRWWNAAASMWGYDVRNQLVADVFFIMKAQNLSSSPMGKKSR